MKKFSVKTIVAIGIGAALFFVLGRFVAIPSPVPNTSICVQYGLLAFLSVVYGPIAGALIGLHVYMCMPDREQKHIRRGLTDIVDELHDIADRMS